MTFAELQTELYARGFSFLDQDAAGRARAKRWINEAYLEDIAADQTWDWLRTSTSGTAPLTISDLDTVISVRDTTNECQLRTTDFGWLADVYGDLTHEGTPEWAYFTGETALAVYPANTDATIQVDYFKVPTELSGDSDEPLMASRWHGLIVDAAVVRAYYDTDNFEAAQLLETRFQQRLARMRASEQVRMSHPQLVVPTDDYWDW